MYLCLISAPKKGVFIKFSEFRLQFLLPKMFISSSAVLWLKVFTKSIQT